MRFSKEEFWRKRKKFCSEKAVINCLFVAGAIFVIAFILNFTQIVITNQSVNQSFSDVLINIPVIIIMWLFLSGVLWMLAFINPDLMNVVFAMLGSKEKEKKESEEPKEEDKAKEDRELDGEKEFQLHILRAQLKHEGKVAYFTTALAVAISFFIFGTTLLLTHPTETLILSIAYYYAYLGATVFVASTVMLIFIQSRIENALDKIRQKFNIKKRL